MASQRRRLHQAVSAVALPGAAMGLFAAITPAPVHAQSAGADLRVVNPHPGASLGTNAFSLDVSFKSRNNSPITTAELWVDGVRWVSRGLDTPQIKNVLSFAVDSTSLSAGQHQFLVRVMTADGGKGEATLSVVAGNNGGTVVGDGDTLAFMEPVNGKHVMGSVELNVDAPARGGSNPIVTIYVDNQFKTLKNFPPYTYNWDSTAVANGMHTLQATDYFEATKETTTRTIRVFVENPGGNTELKHEIADLSARTKSVSTAKTVAIAMPPAPAVKMVPSGEPVISERTIASHAPAAVSAAGMVSALKAPVAGFESDLALLAPVMAAHPHAVAAHAGTATIKTATTLPVHETTLESAGLMTSLSPTVAIHSAEPKLAGLSAPQFLPRTAETVVDLPHFARQHQRLSAVLPGTATAAIAGPAAHLTGAGTLNAELTSPASPTMAAIHRVDAHRLSTSAGPHAVVRAHRRGGVMQIDARPLQVAFNGQQIAFDVQPRVEAGLPIAPFRQIFEHTGGQVDWVAKTQIVHAVSSDKEIVIRVGKADATVNGKNVSMQRPAFVERGRTIVPLSFVGAALDVNVKYDSATGHLQINSK